MAIALVVRPVGAQSDAERMFRKWADERLQVLAKDRNAGERAKAAEYLGGFHYPDVIVALDAALGDPDARVRAAAAGALWKSGKAAEPARGGPSSRRSTIPRRPWSSAPQARCRHSA